MTIPCLYVPQIVASGGMILRLLRTTDATPGVPVTTSTTIPAATYYFPSGSGSLAAAVQGAFGTVDGVQVSVGIDLSTYIATITVTGLDGGTSCTIDWTFSAAAAAFGTALGFSTTVALTQVAAAGAGPQTVTFVATKQIYGYWTPDLPPVSDEDDDERDVVVSETQAGYNSYVRMGQFFGRIIDFQFLAAAKVKVSAETTENTSLERVLRDASGPQLLRYWNDRATLSSGYDDYFLTADTVATFAPKRFSPAVNLYSYTLRMREAQ